MPANNVINFQKVDYYFIFRLYKPILIILLICGYHFDFYKQNWVFTVLAKVYCFTLVTVVVFASVVCCPISGFSQIWSLIEYVLSVLILLFYKSRAKLFFQKISEIDCYLRVKRQHYYFCLRKLVTFAITTWFLRIIYTYLYCVSRLCYYNLSTYIITQISLLALDLNRVWRCILFDAIRYRLKTLRIRLEETSEHNYYFYIRNNKSMKEKKLKFCLYLYRKISDLLEIISPEMFTSLFVSLACCLPKFILDIYHILTVFEGYEPPETIGFVVAHVMQMALTVFTPFVAMELYAVEVESIRLFLMHRLVDGMYDPESREHIEIFLRYTEMRNFRYKIWRMIPINISVPLEMINICVTYVIVVINFTHLYG